MIKNFIIEHEYDKLHERRSELAKRYAECQKELQAIGIPNGFVHKANKYYDERTLERRKIVAAEFSELKKQLSDIKLEIKKKHAEKESVRNKGLLHIFREIFTEEQLQMIYKENDRRNKGEHPIKVSFQWSRLKEYEERAIKYKKLAREQVDKMIEFRILLTDLIDNGCEKFGKADFLKFISPLNMLVIPIAELKKIKSELMNTQLPISETSDLIKQSA